MSRPRVGGDYSPFIGIVDKAVRALRADMVNQAHSRGFTELTSAHNAVFGTLPTEGARASDMALRAGITRQSMGEVIRDMVRLGILEMVPDPTDGRAKIVTYTEYGRKVTTNGFSHLNHLEEMFIAEFGEEDYATARRVLDRVRELLEPDGPSEPR